MAGSTLATATRQTYQDAWDAYASGYLSKEAMWSLLDADEVFCAWFKRRVLALRLAREAAMAEDDGA